MLLLVILLSGWSRPTNAHEVAEEMAAAATNFLAALTPEQTPRAVFPFEAKERQNWHFIPRERQGLPLKEMTPAQRHLAQGLLSSGLSHRGYLKATTIMSLEAILKEIEHGSGPVRDPEQYFFSIFGQPGPSAPWGWRVEGHHLSLNFTIVDGHQITVTPSMFGSNPAEVRSGSRQGLRVLAAEEDLGFALLRSLTPEQRAMAIFSTNAPPDILLTPDRPAGRLLPEGLPGGQLTSTQHSLLERLVQEYVRRYRTELADEDLQRIAAAGWDKVWFAWAGATEPGRGHYFRVQGPTFIFEFDNTQNNANHIHATWRDSANDFGEDLLRRHYETVPHHR